MIVMFNVIIIIISILKHLEIQFIINEDSDHPIDPSTIIFCCEMNLRIQLTIRLTAGHHYRNYRKFKCNIIENFSDIENEKGRKSFHPSHHCLKNTPATLLQLDQKKSDFSKISLRKLLFELKKNF